MASQGVVGKHSGGIAVFVRETWANNTIVWKTAKDGTRIWLRLGCFPKAFVLVHSICCSTRLAICGQQLV
jgi:hypothetical protein